MTVYLVMHWNYEDSWPMAIYSSKERAEQYIAEQSPHYRHGSLEIDEFVIDEGRGLAEGRR